MIRAPLRARVSAMERPMPCAAPVTSATCPWRSTCMAFPFGHPGFALGYAVNLLYQPRAPELSRRSWRSHKPGGEPSFRREGAAVGNLDRRPARVPVLELGDQKGRSGPAMEIARIIVGGEFRPYGQADVVDADAEFPLNHPEHDGIVEGGARQARTDSRGEVDDGAGIGLAVAGQDASQAVEGGGDGQPETFRIR